jgi:hypothetical protein
MPAAKRRACPLGATAHAPPGVSRSWQSAPPGQEKRPASQVRKVASNWLGYQQQSILEGMADNTRAALPDESWLLLLP